MIYRTTKNLRVVQLLFGAHEAGEHRTVRRTPSGRDRAIVRSRRSVNFQPRELYLITDVADAVSAVVSLSVLAEDSDGVAAVSEGPPLDCFHLRPARQALEGSVARAAPAWNQKQSDISSDVSSRGLTDWMPNKVWQNFNRLMCERCVGETNPFRAYGLITRQGTREP